MKRIGRIKFALFTAGVIIFSVTLFSLCFLFDNKYTAEDSQAKVTFLIYGWDIYRGKLLAPEDFTVGLQPDEIVFIGQYAGFEGANSKANPHGCATYRLNISLPPEPAAYTLELPEIYSAYRLYINGIQVEQFGNPDPAQYRPQTGDATVSFIAQNRVEIIVDVSDYSHIYSGMVYPPAFGKTAAVAALLQTRLTVRTAVCAVSAAFGVFFLAVYFFTRKNREVLLFGALCLCFVGYTCYPIVKTIFRGGLAWYGLENFCFCAMLLLVMLLQRSICGDKNRWDKIFISLGIFVCGCSLLQAAISSGNLLILSSYSLIISLYKWATALFLTVSILRSSGKSKHSLTILAGILVFGCGLVMDRLLPSFEPIRFGWFLETGGFAIVLTLGIVMGKEVLRQYRDKLELEGKIAGIERLVEMQRSYYPLLVEGIEEARRARHDLRHHLGMAQSLLLSGETDELKNYLAQYAKGVFNLPALTFCENHTADIVLRYFAVLAGQEKVEFAVDARLPETMSIAEADLCTLISNLLENALEACVFVTGKKKIGITVKLIKDHIVMLVENSFDGYVRTKSGGYLSRKMNREGVGLASVKAVVEKYGGSVDFKPDCEKGVFRSEVVIKN